MRFKSLLEMLGERSTIDSLTHVYNRYFFEEALGKQMAHARERNATFALVFFDIDNFKRVNSEHGHVIGDEVLKRVAFEIKSLMRSQDIAGRFGGDEFMCLLPDSDSTYAVSIAEQAQRKVAGLQAELALHMGLSLSYGVATYPQDGESRADLIEACETRRMKGN